MKLALKIDINLTEDSAQELGLVQRRPIEVDTTMNEGGGPGVIKLPPSSADVAVPFGFVAEGKLIFVETDYPISLKVNSNTGTPLSLEPRATTVNGIRQVQMKGKFLLVGKGVTSLYLTNPSLTTDPIPVTPTVLVSIVGD